MMPNEAIPSMIDRPPDSITLWVIYDHPLDFDGYALRPQFSVTEFADAARYGRIESRHVGPAKAALVIISPLVWYGRTADELRAILPPGCIQIGPGPGDPKHIMEVWMDSRTDMDRR